MCIEISIITFICTFSSQGTKVTLKASILRVILCKVIHCNYNSFFMMMYCINRVKSVSASTELLWNL